MQSHLYRRAACALLLKEKGPNKKTKIVTKSTYIMDEFVKVKTIITFIR